MIYVIGALVLLEAVSIWLIVRLYASERAANALANQLDYEHRVRMEMLRDEISRSVDAEERHNQIEASLREQIQHLAERLSTLRIENGARPEQDRFEQTPKPPEPYSQALQGFLQAIEYEDSRQLVIDDIERLRQENYSDEQILDILNQ